MLLLCRIRKQVSRPKKGLLAHQHSLFPPILDCFLVFTAVFCVTARYSTSESPRAQYTAIGDFKAHCIYIFLLARPTLGPANLGKQI